jgi:hypothetical protein
MIVTEPRERPAAIYEHMNFGTRAIDAVMHALHL